MVLGSLTFEIDMVHNGRRWAAQTDVVYWLRPRSRLLPGGLPRRTSGSFTATFSVAAPTGPPTIVGSTRTSIFASCFSRSITICSMHRRTAAWR